MKPLCAMAVFLVGLIFVATGCEVQIRAKSPEAPSHQATIPSMTLTASPSHPITMPASPTLTATDPPTPTISPSTTPSPTPAPIRIMPDNLSGLKQVQRVGRESPAGEILEISTSLDGKYALIFGETVMVYTLATGEQHVFDGDFERAVLSPDGSRLALAYHDRRLEILTVTGQPAPIPLQGAQAAIEALAWSPDGTRLAGYDRQAGLLIWEAASGNLVKEFPVAFEENLWLDSVVLKWSPDSQKVGLAGVDRALRVAVGDVLIILQGFERPVTHLDWSPDGTRLAASSAHTPTVIIWRVSNWNQILSFSNHKYWVSNVAWSPDSQYLATADAAGTIFIRRASNGSIVDYQPNQGSFELSWSPDGTFLAQSWKLIVFDTATLTALEAPDTVPVWVEMLIWIPGSQKILLSDLDARLLLWDLATGETKVLLDPQVGDIVALDWSPDGKYLALGEQGGGLLVYDPAQMSLDRLAEIEYPFITSLAWSPDSRALAVSSDHQNAVVEVANDLERLTFGTESWRYHVAWHQPEDFLLTGNWDGKILLWDPHTGKTSGAWNPTRDIIVDVAFSPNFERVLIISSRSIMLWNVLQGKQIHAREFENEFFLEVVQWSPDGSQFALLATDFSGGSAKPQRHLYFLDGESLEDRHIHNIAMDGWGHAANLAWSPDGKLLALSNGEIRDAQRGVVLFNVGKGSGVTWTPDGISLIVLRNQIVIWQTQVSHP